MMNSQRRSGERLESPALTPVLLPSAKHQRTPAAANNVRQPMLQLLSRQLGTRDFDQPKNCTSALQKP
jgi:hypothetical protein